MTEPSRDTETGAEIVRFQPRNSLTSKIAYARELAESNLLPAQYRNKPANVLWAGELAEALNVPPVTVINGVWFIDNKPTASAAFISSLVRRAGHKLRVIGNGERAVATITRSDDPDFEFKSEWTIERAKKAGLIGKNTWKSYPESMLKARAVTEVARDACQEALNGCQYTPEELGAEVDSDGIPVVEQVTQPAVDWDAEIKACVGDAEKLRSLYKRAAGNGEVQDRITAEGKKAAAAKAKPAEKAPEPQPEVVDAEIVEDEPRKTLTVEDTVDILIECDIFDAAENIRKRGQSDDVKDFLDEQVCEVLGLKHGASLRLDHFASKVATFVKRHGYSVDAGIDKPAAGSVAAA